MSGETSRNAAQPLIPIVVILKGGEQDSTLCEVVPPQPADHTGVILYLLLRLTFSSAPVVNKDHVPKETIVAARDKVLVQHSFLPEVRHTTICVLEEGAKRVLKNNDGKATCGPIRKANSKGLTRSSLVSNNLPRNGGKIRKNEDEGKKPVAVSDFVSDMTEKLISTGSVGDLSGVQRMSFGYDLQ
ncbi:hypothetical protein V6N12_050141 [Hibiscus sabdariffa]|uniref:Uncharacterized protein n=1 Tax=Hibiscus sabdariffa TaxID=183260 RepID=A0ABR2GC41_9ROSI